MAPHQKMWRHNFIIIFLKKDLLFSIILIIIYKHLICWCVGIGRRDRLKICCQQWRVGSSPTTSTRKAASFEAAFSIVKTEVFVMKKYEAILFDADETLLDFKKSEKYAFFEVLEHWGLNDAERLLAIYSQANKEAWLLFEKGELTKDRLTVYRFERFFEKVGFNDYSPEQWNEFYKSRLGKHGYVLEGVTDILEFAKDRFELYIITNGLAAIQYERIQNAGIAKYFKEIFISEEIGSQKPQKEFFDAVYNKIGIDKDKTLIIGDSLTSDIVGGCAYGVDTCFLNWFDVETKVSPTYQVKNLSELLDLLKKLG